MIMPIVKHTTGPMAGIENLSDPGDTRILIGRARGCDVDYPPEAVSIAEHHLALIQQPSGQWTFDALGAHYVAINGRPAVNAQAVGFGDSFELGEPGGPSFEFLPGEKWWDDDETISC
jgi:hypothetical protein